MEKFTSTLTIDSDTGLLKPVEYLPSPHWDSRPIDTAIDTIVIHGISLPAGQFNSSHIQDFFCGKLSQDAHPTFKEIIALKVSSHLLIKRDGRIIQFVSFAHRAWHAGESEFNGKKRCNDFSIGIELEGTDSIPYEKIQYAELAKVIQLLMQHYSGINWERVVGHSDIAPGRKTDPGPAFDWDYLKGIAV